MDNNTLNFDTYDPQTAFTLRLREASQLRQSAERLVKEGAARAFRSSPGKN